MLQQLYDFFRVAALFSIIIVNTAIVLLLLGKLRENKPMVQVARSTLYTGLLVLAVSLALYSGWLNL